MDITFRNSVLKHADWIYEYLDEVLDHMNIKYPNVNFDNVHYIIGKGSRSRYYRHGKNDINIPVVYIALGARWHTYKKKTIGLISNGMFVGLKPCFCFSVVHELTHHVQYELELNTGELLTTKNEIEYCKNVYPKFYQKLTPIS